MKIFKCREVKTPVRGTNLSAGIDFFIPKYFKETVLKPHEDILIPSGIIANFASNLMLMAAEKSGVTSSATAKTLCETIPPEKAAKSLFNSPTVLGAKIVDADYKGEIHIHLINVGNRNIILKPNMKIAQFILVPVYYDDIIEVATIDGLYTNYHNTRGNKGFGEGTGKD